MTTASKPDAAARLPGENLDMQKMPGHWALARIGKRVLRPGGLELTRMMLEALCITSDDHVVEFAPGLGITACMALRAEPASYTAVERDEAAAALVAKKIAGPNRQTVRGNAEASGLDNAVATVVYGEAMLSMQTLEHKKRIINEAARILKPGGRYAIHEISLVPEDIEQETVERIEHDLGHAIRTGVRPLRRSEWGKLFDDAGLDIAAEATNEFRLLEPTRVLRDEGLFGTLKIAFNMIRDGEARKRVVAMRRAIRSHANHMRAIMLLGVKR